MDVKINTLRLGGVNCYLIKSGEDYFLVDTGFTRKRADLVSYLEKAHCGPGKLKLIVLTHGDSDHTGNCAFLRSKFGAKIAIHENEVESVISGDARKCRKNNGSILGKIGNVILSFLKLKVADRFTPDVILHDGDDLSTFGFDAKILLLPDHTNGSIGILTAQGHLFCGDLLMKTHGVVPGLGIADKDEFKRSIDKVKQLPLQKIYPGHGNSITMEELVKSERLQ
jgi:hydroxyacylglutathione hydrolase